MGVVVPALVGEDGGEVRHLEWRHQHLTLPDAHAVDGAEGPGLLAVFPIVVRRIGDVATFCGRQVDREALTQTERQHVLVPFGEAEGSILEAVVRVLVLLHHPFEDLVEIGIAGVLDRVDDVAGHRVVVAPNERFRAGEPGVHIDHPFVQGDERLHDLVDGAWRVLRLQCAVEKRFDRIALQDAVVRVAHTAHEQLGIIRRARHEAKDLAGLRVDGHDAALLVHHQSLAQLLHLQVDAGEEVLAGHGQRIVQAVLE